MKKILFVGTLFLAACNGCQKKEHEQSHAAKESSADHKIMLNESQRKLANITTQKVLLRRIGETIAVNGKLTINQDQTEVISSRATGRIEKLFVKETGRFIKEGEPLYELYSEALLTLQREYLLAKDQFEALGKTEARYASYLKAAERKLILYGLTPKQIERLGESRKVENKLTFVAPVSGTIAEVNGAEGQSINEGSLLYKIENIGRLWVEAELYPNEMKWIKKGDHIKVSVNGFETLPVETVINFISPEFKAGTQIATTRASISNPEMKFKPGMQAQVIFTHSEKEAIVIPIDAVIRDGNGAHVYVETEPNTFQPRQVKTGVENFDQVEIVDGIKENEIVVATGAYLLYSELIFKRGIDPVAAHLH